MIAKLGRHFFDPIAAVRPFLLVRLLYLLLAVDIWFHFVGRSVLYGIDGFSVAHFGWLDAIAPKPTAALYVGLMIVISFASLVIACVGKHRPLMILVCALFTYSWAVSQLDIYQHHYFLSLVLLLSIFLPDPKPAAGPSHWGTVTAWPFVLIGVQVAILYFYAAVAKIDSRWLTGAVVGNLSTAGQGASTQAVPLLGPMLGETIWPMLAVGAVVIEILLAAGYVLAVVRDRSPSHFWTVSMWLCWLSAMGMHAGIEWFHLRIGLFSYYMMALACVFLLPSSWLEPVASVWASLGRRMEAGLVRSSMGLARFVPWMIAAAVLAVAMPLVMAGLEVPAAGAGLVAAAVLFSLLFLHAAATHQRSLACGLVLLFAVYFAMATLYVCTSNLRSDMHVALAQSDHRSGKLDAALVKYELASRHRIKATGPDEDLVQSGLALNVGDVHQSAGRMVEAAAKYEEAIQLAPKSVMARMNLASLHLAKGRKLEAAELLVQVIELDPANAGARYNMGVILMESKRMEPAIAQFQAAVAADPTLLEAQNNLANAHILMKNLPAAVGPLREIVRQAPDSVDALNNLAIILASSPDPKLRNLEEAITLAQRAAKVTGRQQADILATLARTYSAAGRDADAQAVLEELAVLRRQ